MKKFKFFRGENVYAHQDIILRLMDIPIHRGFSAVLDDDGCTINNTDPIRHNVDNPNIGGGNERI